MALRRYSEELQTKDAIFKKFNFKGEIILKTNIMEISIVKSQSLLIKIKNLYNIVDFEKGDTLNIILGNNEITIIINEKYEKKLIDFLKGEKAINKENDLVALTISFTGKDFFDTPGVIFTTVRKLAWENINIYEIISTMTELAFIQNNKDSMKAYSLLHELFKK